MTSAETLVPAAIAFGWRKDGLKSSAKNGSAALVVHQLSQGVPNDATVMSPQ
jgi:hypothetical protein